MVIDPLVETIILPEEAQKIVDVTYNNPLGGIAVDAQKHEVLSQLKPDIEDILSIEQLLGGG